jgi:hypothetical protein
MRRIHRSALMVTLAPSSTSGFERAALYHQCTAANLRTLQVVVFCILLRNTSTHYCSTLHVCAPVGNGYGNVFWGCKVTTATATHATNGRAPAGARLSQSHEALLIQTSGIDAAVETERGYWTAITPNRDQRARLQRAPATRARPRAADLVGQRRRCAPSDPPRSAARRCGRSSHQV